MKSEKEKKIDIKHSIKKRIISEHNSFNRQRVQHSVTPVNTKPLDIKTMTGKKPKKD